MRQYHETKTKTTHTILPYPSSLTQHIKRENIQTYYWEHCSNKDIRKYCL